MDGPAFDLDVWARPADTALLARPADTRGVGAPGGHGARPADTAPLVCGEAVSAGAQRRGRAEAEAASEAECSTGAGAGAGAGTLHDLAPDCFRGAMGRIAEQEPTRTPFAVGRIAVYGWR